MQEWNESEGAVNAVIPRLPPWAAEPFSRYIENQRMAHRMLEIIKQSVVHTAEVIDATAPDGEFLRTLQTDDFAFLHASSTVTLWSTLEHTIDTLLIAWLVNRSDDIEADQASKIRVPLGEFLPLNAERRADYIFERIEKEYATGKKGTTRFEDLLRCFALSGTTDVDVKNAIFEMQQVRHVIAHRSGKADQKFLDACPHFGVGLDAPLRISSEQWQKYHAAANAYIVTVVTRVASKLDV